MPPRRRSAADSLTPDDLAKLTAALAEGRRATVYLREGTPSLGLVPGSSARVVSVDGTTLVVRPRGVDDELPYEADELRMTKNAPEPSTPKAAKRAAKPAAEPRPRAAAAPRRTAAPAAAKPAAAETASTAPASPTSPSPAIAGPVSRKTPGQKPATRRSAAKGAPKSVTVTLYGSAENEWSVALTRGARKPQRARSVTPEAADAAVRELGDPVAAEAVTALLHSAREEAQRRVEELSRELEAARQALAALDNTR